MNPGSTRAAPGALALADQRQRRTTADVSLALLKAALLALVAWHVAVLAYHLGSELGFAYDLNYGEGYVLNDAVRLSRGEPIYVDIQQFPMVRSPYPPLFPLVWSGLLGLTGPEFLAGRALSIAGLGVLVGLIGWNAWRARAGTWSVLAAVGLLVASPFVYDWAGYARVDMLALALAGAGLLSAQWVRGRWGIVGAAVLCGLAVWTKQTTLTAAVAVSIALGLRRWRDGIAFLALLGVPSVLVGLVLQYQTQGEFARHVLVGNAANPLQPLRAAYYLGAFVALHLPALAAGVWWVRRALRGVPSPVAVYLPIALLASASVGNEGSSVNYLIEPVVALALALPFAWRALPQAAVMAGPLFAAVQLALLLHVPNGFGTGYLAEASLGRTPSAGDAAIGARLDAVVRQEPGAVLAEPAGVAVRTGRPVFVQPIDLRAEERLGRWRAQPLVDALASGQFSLVITSYDLLPETVARAVRSHFEVVETLPSPDGLQFRVLRYRG